MLRFEDMVKK